MVGHHPLESHGEHSGRLLDHPQDLAGPENRRMRRALEGTFAGGSPFIYASGHDHSLEVIRRGPGRYSLVSGSGIGVQNTRARLHMLYEDEAKFELRDQPPRGVMARITLPFTLASAQ